VNVAFSVLSFITKRAIENDRDIHISAASYHSNSSLEESVLIKCFEIKHLSR